MKNKKTSSLRIARMHIPSHIIMIIWCFISITPIALLIFNSLKDRKSLFMDPFGFPLNITFDNYTSVIKDSNFFRYFGNSLFVVVGSLTVVLLLGSLCAFALAHWKGKASKIIYFFFIVGMMLPIKIATIRLLELMKVLGLLNTLWSLLLVYSAMGMPIAIFVLTEFIRSLPSDLYDAAYIDGAKRLKIYYGIVIPLIKPALATVAIYNLVPIWNDLWFPLIFITKEEVKTVLLAVTRLQGQYATDWPKVFALLTMSALPVLILYLTMSKQFVAGLTAGAVKG
ncbi:MAG: carbohydrate ABC transporter permease [Christensenellaceae bacterium]|nr:carbohydrate ABC transporter permease [Christensenellaceae bacterium]